MQQTHMDFSESVEDSIKVAIIKVIKDSYQQALADRYPQYMTKQETADYLQISSHTLDAWLQTTNTPYKRIGKIYRFNKHELDKFMLSN